MVEPDESMTPQEATKRRDLTINSMGYDPVKQEFIDPYNGQEDLKNKILRATDKETFGDDPLRVLRIMRFAGNLGFTIDPELVEICKGLSDSLKELPKERIYGEMEKLLLKSKIPSKGIQTIPLLGIKLFPELTDMIGVEQDDLWHPEGDVWTHTLMALDDAAKKKEQFEDPKDKMIYMLATLLHDVGKPKTPGLNEKGRITHRKHSEVGAQMAVEFMKKRLTDEDVVLSKVENLIRFHMTPTEFHKAKIADSAIRKLAKKLDIPMLVAVSSADKQGRGKSLRNKLTAERWLMKKYHTLGLDKPEALKPIVMGRHLIELGVQPGISMGKILSELYESQLSGRFDTVESGIEFARKIGLLEPIQKGFYVERNIAMKQLLELRKNKNDGKLIPMRDNGKVRWFKSYGAEGLWRKTIGAPVVGSTILIKGKLCKVTATGKDGVIARESENKYEVLYKDVELMKGL
jgi:tRNA nucleotidyltransferase (CCA-adding enzyme)